MAPSHSICQTNKNLKGYPLFASRRQFNASKTGSTAPWAWATLGTIVGILIAFTLFFPAAWLGYVIEKNSNGRVFLGQAQGTIWRGSAQLIFSGGTGSRDATALPGRINWKLRPALPLNMMLNLSADCCTTRPIEAFLIPHLNGLNVAIQANESVWPASLLTGLGAPFNTIDLQGSLKLNLQAMNLNVQNQALKIEGNAELDILDATTRLSTVKPIGSYRVSLKGGTIPTINVQTLNGSMQLTGSGEFANNRLRFKGEATATPGSEAALNNFLDILGRRVGPRSLITFG